MAYSKAQVKAARHAAHCVFDRYWKSTPAWCRNQRRKACYRWLRGHFGMSAEECHIRFFDVGMCEAVIELCWQAEMGLIEKPNSATQKRRAPLAKGEKLGRTQQLARRRT